MNNTQDFINAKHFIDRIILREMKINKISAISFINQKPTKEVTIIDVSEDDEEPVEEIKTPQKMEYFMNAALVDVMKKHYESLYFSWQQQDNLITISWS